MKKLTIRALLLIVATFIATNNTVAMDFNSLLTTDNSHLFSRKFKPVYYTARGLKKIHNVAGDFAAGLSLAHNKHITINPSHAYDPESLASTVGVLTGVINYNIKISTIPFILSYLHREATNIFFNHVFSLGTTGTGLDYRTLCPNLISSYLTLAAGIGTAYWLSKDGIDLCTKLFTKDHQFFAEMHSSQPNSREYNIQQLDELQFFTHKNSSDPEKVKKITNMLISKNDDLGPCFKNTVLSYSQRLANCSLLKAAIRNENHTLQKIIKTFGRSNTISMANEASRSFNIENCMICQEQMDDYTNLTDFSCKFHSLHKNCFNDLQENYYQGKSDPDKRRCIICT